MAAFTDYNDGPAPARHYRVWIAGIGVVSTPTTFAQAMTDALRLAGPDDVVTIDRSTPTRGLFIMQARYLPTGPGRGWDFGMMSSDEQAPR